MPTYEFTNPGGLLEFGPTAVHVAVVAALVEISGVSAVVRDGQTLVVEAENDLSPEVVAALADAVSNHDATAARASALTLFAEWETAAALLLSEPPGEGWSQAQISQGMYAERMIALWGDARPLIGT